MSRLKFENEEDVKRNTKAQFHTKSQKEKSFRNASTSKKLAGIRKFTFYLLFIYILVNTASVSILFEHTLYFNEN